MSLRRHDTIRNTIHGTRSLDKAFKDMTLSTADDAIRRTRERDRTIVILSNLLDALKTVADPFLSSFLLDQLEIEIHQGLTGDQVLMGPFFSPWSAEVINAHPIDMDKHGTSLSLRRSKHAIDFGSPVPGLFDGPAGRVARVSGLIVQLMHCPRKPSGASLANIAGWRHSSCPLPSGYSLLCTKGSRWESSDCWFRPSKKSPHVKVLMRNTIEAKEGEPSREEIFVIAYMMIHRLQSEGMDKHVIAPVMLLSIMAECHGRILIAYCDGGKLVVQMSELHCFYSRYQDSYTLMMRYLAAGDEGDTTTLLAKRGP